MVVVPGFYEDRKQKVPKPTKPVVEERSSPSNGNQVDVQREGSQRKRLEQKKWSM